MRKDIGKIVNALLEFKAPYERNDCFKQYMEVIAAAFSPENIPENLLNLQYLAEKVLEAGDNYDITPNNVNGLRAELKRRGIDADYLSIYV